MQTQISGKKYADDDGNDFYQIHNTHFTAQLSVLCTNLWSETVLQHSCHGRVRVRSVCQATVGYSGTWSADKYFTYLKVERP